MFLKSYKPVTSGFRHRIIVSKDKLWKGDPIKQLTQKLNKTGGRNHFGRTTVFTKSKGHKQKYRIIDFKRSLFNVPAKVERFEYDPNRSVFLALVKYTTGTLSYILAPEELKIGQTIISGTDVPFTVGNTLPLQYIPEGTFINTIELKPGAGGKLCRAAGSYGKLITKTNFGYGLVRLKSGQEHLIYLKCLATIGILSNLHNKNIKLGKAGASRWLGRKPTVRGVAMNPIDHPHGGGEGKTSGGRISVTPWGKYTKGKKTRKNTFTNKYIIS